MGLGSKYEWFEVFWNYLMVGHAKAKEHVTRVIAVTGGKGGVGKTNVSINLAISAAKSGQRVLLLDADLGLANVDVLLGLKPKRNLEAVLKGECQLQDIILTGPSGLQVIPATSGTQSMVKLSEQEHAGLIAAFSELADSVDLLVIDTAAGISDSVVNFVRAAQEVVVVVCDEPSSITDAYALIKVLRMQYNVDGFRVLANQTRSDAEGVALFKRLVAVTDRFLEVNLRYAGSIPYDDAVRKAVKKQEAVTEMFPGSKVSKAFSKLHADLLDWPYPEGPSGYLQFFVEQLVGMRVSVEPEFS